MEYRKNGVLDLYFILLGLSFTLCVGQKEQENNASSDVLIIVLSQSNGYHVERADLFKSRFQSQVQNLKQEEIPRLLFTHSDFVETTGTWTVFPLLQNLMESSTEMKFRWLFICEDETHVDVHGLVDLLAKFDADERHFLGRALRDHQSTIIHHFAFSENPEKFAYPDFMAGFAMSTGLIKRIMEMLQTEKLKTDFSIDPKHELALFIWEDGKGTSLTNVPEFCSTAESSNPDCITRQPILFPDCPEPIEHDDLFVAVKTCKQFHNTRVKVVQETWGKEAELIEFYSEEANKSIPTVYLGVPNTERGHCGKTLAIIKRAMVTPYMSQPSWFLIADDDTIINLERLRALLACYKSDQPVALGERYGYATALGGGYDYITGGGGMVFSHLAVRQLSERCSCYADDAPDDMTLGMCLKGIGIPISHSRYFHQARPADYSKELLANQIPVSFHKHWEVDPYKVYADLTRDPLPDRKAKVVKKDEL